MFVYLGVFCVCSVLLHFVCCLLVCSFACFFLCVGESVVAVVCFSVCCYFGTLACFVCCRRRSLRKKVVVIRYTNVIGRMVSVAYRLSFGVPHFFLSRTEGIRSTTSNYSVYRATMHAVYTKIRGPKRNKAMVGKSRALAPGSNHPPKYPVIADFIIP